MKSPLLEVQGKYQIEVETLFTDALSLRVKSVITLVKLWRCWQIKMGLPYSQVASHLLWRAVRLTLSG